MSSLQKPHSGAHFWRDVIIMITLVVVAVLVLAQQWNPAHARASWALPTPANTTESDLRPPPTPLQIVAATLGANKHVDDALTRARAAIPEVPWGTWGLADVRIEASQIRFDAVRERYVVALEDGRTAILTLEPNIQKRVERAMARATEPGEATVVVEPETGRVLALADDGDKEFGENLARRSYAWAASTFKLITAAAIFSYTHETSSTQTCFHGGGQGVTEDLLRDNKELDTLCISFQRAMALSANVVFARHADRLLQPAQLQKVANDFGFNTKIPFEMTVERSSFITPTDRLEFARAAAGFQHSRMSPLHGALIEATIANGGVMMVPTIVASIEDAQGNTVWTHHPVEWRTVLDGPQAQQMLDVQATTCVNGTAAADFGSRAGWPTAIRTWGKTGTLLNRSEEGVVPNDPRTYKWFTGIAEREDQRIAVTSLVVQNPSWQIRGSYLASEAVLGAFLNGGLPSR